MNERPVIVVVGNCQARPLARAFSALSPTGADIARIAVVHLLTDSDEAQYAPYFAAADWILAQSVADSYPCQFIRTATLQSRYGGKVLRWPNLFYHGYNPELTYLRGSDRRPLSGPLGDYHNATVLEGWLRGMTASEALQMHLDEEYNRLAYAEVPERSLCELQRREEATDVQVTPWIRQRRWQQRLFFTFNHPAHALIMESARQLALAAGLEPVEATPNGGPVRETLGAYRPPMNPWVRRSQGCTLEEPGHYTGVEVLAVNNGLVVVGKKCSYEPLEFVEACFRIYDGNRKLLTARARPARASSGVVGS